MWRLSSNRSSFAKCKLFQWVYNYIVSNFIISNNNYIIKSVIHAFWLVLTYDLLEDRCTIDVIKNPSRPCFVSSFEIKILLLIFVSLLYKTNRFHLAVRLFSYRSQRTSKYGKNISDPLAYRLVGHFSVLTTFWRHLWSITEQTHGQMESIC